MRNMIAQSGLLWSCLLVIGLLSFSTIAIDRAEVKRVVIVGDLNEFQLSSIKRQLAGVANSEKSAMTITTSMNALEWVHGVNVRRDWPNGYSIEVFPEQVIAYWNDDAYVNEVGDVLVSELIVAGDVPHLYGPAGSELDVMSQYQALSQTLKDNGHEIQVLTRSERGSWSVETRDKLLIMLGKEDLKARVRRFLAVSEDLHQRGDTRKVQSMDARYVNGVAVQFSDQNQINLADINKKIEERSL